MSEFDDLQHIWQGQKADVELPAAEETLAGIRQLQKSVRRERRMITYTFLSTFVVLGGTTLIYPRLFFVVGIVIVILAMTIIMWLFWKNKEAESGAGFEASNRQFLEKNIRFMQKRREITSHYMPLYAFLLILGLNVSYIDLLQEMGLEIGVRIALHLGFSLLMALFFYIGIKKHLHKFDKKVQPLIDGLRKMIENK